MLLKAREEADEQKENESFRGQSGHVVTHLRWPVKAFVESVVKPVDVVLQDVVDNLSRTAALEQGIELWEILSAYDGNRRVGIHEIAEA